MIVALIDSGFGLLPTAAWLRKLRPDVDLLLQLDPDGAPWGPKPHDWVIERVVSTARTARDLGAEVVVLPCNTASVTALEHVRAELGSQVPVVGTVPAIKPAAAACRSIAVWATAATTASPYQADLIARFGGDAKVTGVACHGLAEAVDRGSMAEVRAAVADAAARTPADVEGVVLGCTHYPLIVDTIVAALPDGVRLFDSAQAVAAQTVRRMEALGDMVPGDGTVQVRLSGLPGALPLGAAAYESGRILGAGRK
ncbi:MULTISPECIES: glutamate racemase [Nocardia]|uniref:glutamate racemase n=1 Tax=Nocardia TaxID=1817 RepID=UPI00189345FA|nr:MULTISPECIES: aspartate/glutamate racemase family protein [Nocardia]MBF6352729.1 aspartate/glutamate racemase family protein [Nocardia flavorosea]